MGVVDNFRLAYDRTKGELADMDTAFDDLEGEYEEEVDKLEGQIVELQDQIGSLLLEIDQLKDKLKAGE